MTSVNSHQLVLHYLTVMQEQLHAGLAHEATLNLCRAYALEPVLSIHRLVALPSHGVRAVLSKLEDWCSGACASTSDNVLRRHHIPLTWEQVCDITLSQGLAPQSHPAWCLKIQCQMHEKRYAHVVDTCTKALRLFEGRRGELQPYWLQRGLAYLFLREFQNAVLDYSAAFKADRSACHAYVTKYQKAYTGSILSAFYHTLASLEMENRNANNPEEYGPVASTLHQFILAFEENPAAYRDCAGHMMKQRKFPEAITFLTMAMKHAGSGCAAGDRLQLLLSRAECHVALDQVDMALRDYVAAATVDEELTRITLMSLPIHQQGTLVARAKRVASDALAQCRTQGVLKRHPDAPRPNLEQAAGFFQLLYLMDEEFVDALYSAAECRKLLGRFAEAIQLFTRFIRLRPKSHRAFYNRACCHVECDDVQSALSDYNAVLGLQPAYVQALCGRAWLWIKIGNPRQAVTDLASASAIGTDLSARWLKELSGQDQGHARTTLRDHLRDHLRDTAEGPRDARGSGKALAVVDLLTLAWPQDVASHLLYKDMLMSLGKPDEAQAVLVRLQKNNPEDPAATAHLAAFKMARGKITPSLEDLVAALKAHGEAELRAALVSVEHEQRALIAREAHGEGLKRMRACPDDPDVEGLFTLAVCASPCGLGWESYLWRAKLHFRLQNLDAALADCTAALAIAREGGDSAQVLCWRALVLLRSKKVKTAYLDFLRALLHDSETLERFVGSREAEEKQRLLIGLERCTQELFCYYLRSGNKLKSVILTLCRLLVRLDSASSLYHSDFADAWIINGDYRNAAEELNEAERYSPENVSVLSRGSLVQMILGNVTSSVLKLVEIARLNVKGLEVPFKLFSEEQKQRLVSESIAHAPLPSADDRRALLFHTVAVFASNGQNAQVLRARSQCLERLRCFDQAIGDLSMAIAIGPRQVEDLCARANLHLLNENTMGSCCDFIAAMEMDGAVAKSFISRCAVGKGVVLQHFLKAAEEQLRGRNFPAGLEICAHGLRIDPGNGELAQLKLQLEYSARKCTIQ